jgi:hypothetical protein
MVRIIFNLQNIYMGNKKKGIHFFQRLPKDAQEKIIDECIDSGIDDDDSYECSLLNYVIDNNYGNMKGFLYSVILMNSYWEDILIKYS